MNDPLDSAIPVGSGAGQTVPPSPPLGSVPPPHSPPPAPAVPPRVAVSGNEKIWALASHLSGFIGMPFLIPVIIYLAMKGDSEYVACNAREALNFHLSLLIYSLCCVPLVFLVIGIPLLILIWLASLVFAIVAAVKAVDGGCYRYPATIRLIS